MNYNEIIKESEYGVKLRRVFSYGEFFYVVGFPDLPGEPVSLSGFKAFRNFDDANFCYQAFIRGYEYAKAN